MLRQNNNEAVHYILYVRKSTDSEDRQMASIEDQIKTMKRFAKERNLKIVDIIEESKSAKKPGRPGFNLLMKNLEHGKANGILVWKLNRLARNPVDGGLVSWMLQKSIIKHIQTFTSNFKHTDNVLMMQVEFGIANQYIIDLSTDVIRGLSLKAQRGWWPSTRICMGYLHNTNYRLGIDDEIINDPQRFDIVKKLWSLMLTGQYSVPEIMREAKRTGLKNSKGNPYSVKAFYNMFTNSFYCGEFYWANEYGDHILIQGKHNPMVTKSDFQKVQILLKGRGKPTRINKYSFPFRGPLSCGECKCSITADHKLQAICTQCKNKFSIKTKTECPGCGLDFSNMNSPSIIDKTYYHCTKKRGPCSQKSIEATSLRNQIKAYIRQISLPEEVSELFLEIIKEEEKIAHDKAAENQLGRKLKAALRETESRKENLIDMRANGEINREDFQNKYACHLPLKGYH